MASLATARVKTHLDPACSCSLADTSDKIGPSHSFMIAHKCTTGKRTSSPSIIRRARVRLGRHADRLRRRTRQRAIALHQPERRLPERNELLARRLGQRLHRGNQRRQLPPQRIVRGHHPLIPQQILNLRWRRGAEGPQHQSSGRIAQRGCEHAASRHTWSSLPLAPLLRPRANHTRQPISLPISTPSPTPSPFLPDVSFLARFALASPLLMGYTVSHGQGVMGQTEQLRRGMMVL
jgi:hypothetical protein